MLSCHDSTSVQGYLLFHILHSIPGILHLLLKSIALVLLYMILHIMSRWFINFVNLSFEHYKDV